MEWSLDIYWLEGINCPQIPLTYQYIQKWNGSSGIFHCEFDGVMEIVYVAEAFRNTIQVISNIINSYTTISSSTDIIFFKSEVQRWKRKWPPATQTYLWMPWNEIC